MPDRDSILHALGLFGAQACPYTPAHADPQQQVEIWQTTRCDCKYGGSGAGEQTGCPEMRSLYAVLERIDDELWETMQADVLMAALREESVK